jgi:L-fuculose-phosphate aldolase
MAELRDEAQARRDLAEVGRLLYERDLLAARDGNLSVVLGPGRILTTPAGVCKGRLGPEDFVVVDGRGAPLDAGGRAPSTEIKMHLAIYPVRPDVRAIVHTHPPAATAFAVAGVPIDKAALAEVVYNLGIVPLTEYALPSTEKLAAIIGHYIPYYQALLLANHGVLAVGTDLWDAYYRLEGVEHFARILIYARQLGGAKELSQEAVAELCDLRRRAGVTAPNPLCDGPPAAWTQSARPDGGLPPPELVEAVAREVVTQLRARFGAGVVHAAG